MPDLKNATKEGGREGQEAPGGNQGRLEEEEVMLGVKGMRPQR